MTAPIVWHNDRTPMRDLDVPHIGRPYASTKIRATYGKGTLIAQRNTPGDLWRREEERDVAVHGEPTAPRLRFTGSLIGPYLARLMLDVEIERRRAARRAAVETVPVREALERADRVAQRRSGLLGRLS